MDPTDELPSLVVGVGRGSVLLKRHNDLVEAMRITSEDIQLAIERARAAEKRAERGRHV